MITVKIVSLITGLIDQTTKLDLRIGLLTDKSLFYKKNYFTLQLKIR